MSLRWAKYLAVWSEAKYWKAYEPQVSCSKMHFTKNEPLSWKSGKSWRKRSKGTLRGYFNTASAALLSPHQPFCPSHPDFQASGGLFTVYVHHKDALWSSSSNPGNVGICVHVQPQVCTYEHIPEQDIYMVHGMKNVYRLLHTYAGVNFTHIHPYNSPATTHFSCLSLTSFFPDVFHFFSQITTTLI